VVIGAVRSGVTGPQQAGKDFPGAVTGTVIDAGDERGEAVAALVSVGDVFLL
jgi:hypothetical protein